MAEIINITLKQLRQIINEEILKEGYWSNDTELKTSVENAVASIVPEGEYKWTASDTEALFGLLGQRHGLKIIRLKDTE